MIPVPDANPAIEALEASGIDHRLTEHGTVRSLEEAAAARGMEPRQVLKTLVVRRADDDFLFVLVPGDRQISWPKLRTHVGASRLSMPDAAMAHEATGYERGTITPFGSTTAWPVIADSLVVSREGPVSIGAGAPGVAANVDPTSLVDVLGADVVDVTEPL
jgi:Cys-tRNA(Pro) deacylase